MAFFLFRFILFYLGAGWERSLLFWGFFYGWFFLSLLTSVMPFFSFFTSCIILLFWKASFSVWVLGGVGWGGGREKGCRAMPWWDGLDVFFCLFAFNGAHTHILAYLHTQQRRIIIIIIVSWSWQLSLGSLYSGHWLLVVGSLSVCLSVS
ncbi:hypothetical protein BZA05DRAFT_403657 [Tricharina praecox]|uniref:uncharacterized protein n=1 Tax=Tricharina praecox TaxID=43433 RepID=UPI002220D10F|nr:uncharacterized protein BZA05DRAFT_403657 [Tricharina praecox]KAI5848315.1 hypothetical protein BZA05DRAFT_403657 [Tricharina praecox]